MHNSLICKTLSIIFITGSKFAMIELKIVLHMILKNYEVITVEKEEDLNLYSEIVLLNKGGIRIQLRRRY